LGENTVRGRVRLELSYLLAFRTAALKRALTIYDDATDPFTPTDWLMLQLYPRHFFKSSQGVPIDIFEWMWSHTIDAGAIQSNASDIASEAKVLFTLMVLDEAQAVD